MSSSKISQFELQMKSPMFLCVVIFGDLDNGKAVGYVLAAKAKAVYHTGDNICQGEDLILTSHLTVSLLFGAISWRGN